jgi:hypothetical protein
MEEVMIRRKHQAPRSVTLFVLTLVAGTVGLNLTTGQGIVERSAVDDDNAAPEVSTTIGFQEACANQTSWNCLCRRFNENSGKWMSNWHGTIRETYCNGVIDCYIAKKVAQHDASGDCNHQQTDAGVVCKKCSCR